MDGFRVPPTPAGGIQPSHQAVSRTPRDGSRERRRDEFRRALGHKGDQGGGAGPQEEAGADPAREEPAAASSAGEGEGLSLERAAAAGEHIDLLA